MNPFNLILRFLTLKLQLLVLMILAYALVIKDTGYESTVQSAAVLYTSMLKILIKFSLPKSASGHLVQGMLQRLWGMRYFGALSSSSDMKRWLS